MSQHTPPASDRSSTGSSPRRPSAASQRARYVTPRLEPLGAWSALTLQQSVGIGPGGMIFFEPGRIKHLD